MTVQVCRGNPQYNGLYAVRQWYCWRILEWVDGAWWHPGRSAKWPVGEQSKDTGIEAWSGPLPVISKDYTKPLAPTIPAAPMEFDL